MSRARWMRNRLLQRRLVAALLAILSVAACEDAKEGAKPVATTASPRVPAASVVTDPAVRERVVRALALRPEDMSGTARYSLRTVEAESGFVFFSVEGTADFEKERYRARVETKSKDDPARVFPVQEYFVSGTTVYELLSGRWLTDTKPPYEIGTPLPLGPVIGPDSPGCTSGYANDRSARTQIVDTLVTDIELVGIETLRSTDTRHYRVHIESDKTAALSPELRTQIGTCGGVPTSDLDIDVWLEGDRLRQFAFAWTGEAFGSGFGFQTEYWDYDRVPSPAVPPGLPVAPR